MCIRPTCGLNASVKILGSGSKRGFALELTLIARMILDDKFPPGFLTRFVLLSHRESCLRRKGLKHATRFSRGVGFRPQISGVHSFAPIRTQPYSCLNSLTLFGYRTFTSVPIQMSESFQFSAPFGQHSILTIIGGLHPSDPNVLFFATSQRLAVLTMEFVEIDLEIVMDFRIHSTVEPRRTGYSVRHYVIS